MTSRRRDTSKRVNDIDSAFVTGQNQPYDLRTTVQTDTDAEHRAEVVEGSRVSPTSYDSLGQIQRIVVELTLSVIGESECVCDLMKGRLSRRGWTRPQSLKTPRGLRALKTPRGLRAHCKILSQPALAVSMEAAS